MKAILKYPGAKWRLSRWIISHFPAHKVYLEPYFGSGAVFFNKTPSAIETINDIDGNIVNLFRVCREQPDELAKLISLTPVSREEYISCGELSLNNLEQARRTLVRFNQSFGTSNSSLRSWRNSQTANSPRIPYQWSQLPQIILDCCERLKNAQIECCDALTLIERYNDKDTLVYVDPPYLPTLRKKNLYKNELTLKDHIQLLELLQKSKSKIILSAYASELYDEVLKNWKTTEIKTIAQMGLPRIETLYMNFTPQNYETKLWDYPINCSGNCKN